jgi:hypothetical protein
MRRACLIGTFTLLVSLLVVIRAFAQAPEREGLRRVATLGAEGLPSLAVAPDGQAALLWKALASELDTSSLWVARSPLWLPEPLALSPEEQGAGDLTGRIDHVLTIAYSYPFTRTQVLQRVTLDEPPFAPQPQPFRDVWTWTLDERGLLAAAWAEDALLVVWRESTGLTQTVSLPVNMASEPQSITALRLAVDDGGVAHLAWAVAAQAGAPGGLYYAIASDQDATPVLVSTQGHSLMLATGPAGQAHLAWAQEGALHYAHSGDWGQAREVAMLEDGTAVFALAAGLGQAGHLVWHAQGRLWYANTADLQSSLLPIAEEPAVTWVAAAADGRGRVHVAWVAQDDARELYYRRLFEPPPQLALVYPLGGELLLDDSDVRAITNLAPGELSRVEFYLQQERGGAAAGALIELGVDSEGEDGWAAQVRIASLLSASRYRAMALGIMRDGQILRTTGPWFSVQPPTRPQLWLYGVSGAPPEADVRAVSLWSPSEDAWPMRVDLYAWPVQTDRCRDGVGCEPLPSAEPHYLGVYSLDRPRGQVAGATETISFSVRALSEGAYTLAALASDGKGASSWVRSDELFQVLQAPRAAVEIVAPTSAVVPGGRLVLAARIEHPVGAVQRVDFYLERVTSRLAQGLPDDGAPSSSPELMWVASDSDGIDGWMANLMVSDYWLGGPWVAWAFAHDERGLAASARSARPFVLLGDAHAEAQWVTPLGKRALSGVEQIVVNMQGPAETDLRLTVYLAEEPGLRALGQLVPEGRRWALSWDTRTVADGRQQLLLLVEHADGRHSIYHSGPLVVSNAQAEFTLTNPVEGSELAEEVILRISSGMEDVAPALDPAPVYLRDAEGRLLLIGELTPTARGWRGVWDSHSVLDGAYTILVLVRRPDGSVARLERQVTVRNETPTIALSGQRQVWRGLQRVFWRAETPSGGPLRVAVEYSPDDGGHWVALARDVPAEQSLLWDTRNMPDTTQGRLRLTVCGDRACARETSERLTLDNVNRAPSVTLLRPLSGDVKGQEVRVSWAAWDADGDALVVDLAFRRAEGVWQPLLIGAPNSGQYVWDARQLAPGHGYALRVTVRDGRGGQAVALQDRVTLSDNSPPTVRLVWPNEGIRLTDEVAILYHAADRDRDPLAIDLHYSDNGGATWLPLAEGLENTGYYVWRVSFLPPGAQYRLRVIARDGQSQATDESDGVFAVGRESRPQVRLWAPEGGSTLSGLQIVRWAVNDPDRRALRAEVSMRFAGATLWWPLASDLPNEGIFVWDTRTLPDGAYALRVTVGDGVTSASATTMGVVGVQNRGNRAPAVTLLAPLGGEVWSGLGEIAWAARDWDGDAMTATVSISPDGGLVWRDIARLDARVGTALWDTTTWPTGERYLVRVRVNDGRATTEVRSAGIVTLANRRTTPPHIATIALQQTGALANGGLVTWLAEDADGDALALDVGLSADGGNTWEELASGLANTGEYVLGRAWASEGGAWLRLIADDGLYRVQSTLALDPTPLAESQRPDLEIMAPGDGVTWSGAQEIRWQARDPLGQRIVLRVEASGDGGLTWQMLGRDLPNTGSLAWDTATVPNGAYRLRLTASNGRYARTRLGPTVTTENTGRQVPTMTLLAPRGGEVWWGMQEIRWQASDADGDPLTVRLFYSVDRGGRWVALSPPLSDGASYVCDTTTLPNAEEVWISATASDGLFSMRVVAAGSVAVRNAQGPVVRLAPETAAPHWQGVQTLRWNTAHASGRNVQVSLEVSVDGGAWQSLATGLPPQGNFAWDTATVPEGSWVRLRAVAKDGLAQGVAVLWEPIRVWGNAPRAVQPLYPR